VTEKRRANHGAADRLDESPATPDRPLGLVSVHSVFLRNHAGFSRSFPVSITTTERRRLNTVPKKFAMSLSDQCLSPTQDIMLTSQMTPRSPWHNPYCERVIGSICRGCLSRLIVLSEGHLKRIRGSCFSVVPQFDVFPGSAYHCQTGFLRRTG
jgi:hypothetical protein